MRLKFGVHSAFREERKIVHVTQVAIAPINSPNSVNRAFAAMHGAGGTV